MRTFDNNILLPNSVLVVGVSVVVQVVVGDVEMDAP